MLRVIPAPADLLELIAGCVIIDAPAALTCTHFPADVGSMLIVRTAGHVQREQGSDTTPIELPRGALVGASTRPTRFIHEGAVSAIGLILKPQVVPCLLRDTPAGLVDRAFAASDLLGPEWSRTEQALHLAHFDDARSRILFDFVRRSVARPRDQDRRLRIQRMTSAVSAGIGLACDELAMSRRQLERRFVIEVGMTPKRFQTIVRMSNALRRSASASRAGAQIAIDAGYFDQSHMARDLRRLAGDRLTRLAPRNRERLHEYWPVEAGLLLA